MLKQFFLRWNDAWKQRLFRIAFLVALSGLVACALVAPTVFSFVQQREGVVLHDVLLDALPAQDLSPWIFSIIYFLIVISLVYLVQFPNQLLLGMVSYALLTIFRFVMMWFTPLEAPAAIIPLNDPFVERFFYQQMITKDLFFSGHTSILFMLGLVVSKPTVKALLFTSSFLVGGMVLVQHAHYSIDVLAAPFFAWLAFRVASNVLKNICP